MATRHPYLRSLQIALLVLTAATSRTLAQEAQPVGPEEAPADPALTVAWTVGPARVDLGTRAELNLPTQYRFTAGDDTRKLLELMGNPTSGAELGLVMPADGAWFVAFEYSDTGHIKDDDRNDLNGDKILETIRAGTEHSNEARKKRGWPPLEILGWQVAPRYDEATHNLEWAVRATSEGMEVVNFNTRILGRTGVMECSLVVEPAGLAAALPGFRELLGGFAFKQGERYAEFREGDKLAQYGLTALVAGGAAAVALKSGLLQKLLKPVLLGLLALGMAMRRVFGRMFGKRRKDSGPVNPG